MTMEETVIRNGTIVTANGMMERDLWIRGGKIIRIAKDVLGAKRIGKKGGVQEWDATGMYVLPGFVAMPDTPVVKQRKKTDYLAAERNLVAFGYTCKAEMLPLRPWRNAAQRRYQSVIHYNSMIDYTLMVEVSAPLLDIHLLRQLCAEGYRIIRVRIRHPEEIFRLDWETLSPTLTSYKVLLTLAVPEESGFSREERKRISSLWLHRCRYWQIRTWVQAEGDLPVEEEHSFYHLYQAEGVTCDQALRSFIHTPFQPLSVMAGLDSVHIDLRRMRCRGEELLSALVKLCATNTAKAMGLYPRKGSISLGADADLLFLKKEQWLTKFDLSTILKFSEIRLPTSVMSNGKWILHGEQFSPMIGMGRCLLHTKPYSFVM